MDGAALEPQGVGREHPLSVEKLFPVLSVYRAKSVDEALKAGNVIKREAKATKGGEGAGEE